MWSWPWRLASRVATKARDFIEEVAKCQTYFSPRFLQKKSATSKGCAESTKGGGWRRQIRRAPGMTASERHAGSMMGELVRCKNNLVRRDKIGFDYWESTK